MAHLPLAPGGKGASETRTRLKWQRQKLSKGILPSQKRELKPGIFDFHEISAPDPGIFGGLEPASCRNGSAMFDLLKTRSGTPCPKKSALKSRMNE